MQQPIAPADIHECPVRHDRLDLAVDDIAFLAATRRLLAHLSRFHLQLCPPRDDHLTVRLVHLDDLASQLLVDVLVTVLNTEHLHHD